LAFYGEVNEIGGNKPLSKMGTPKSSWILGNVEIESIHVDHSVLSV
jgi:hypothetical protein